jgi:CubicO group peptidase (beta-lactamase class C family)
MKKLVLCFLAFLYVHNALFAQDNAKAHLIATIDSILNGAVHDEKIPGAVIRVQQNGKVIYTHAYGYSQKYDYHHRLLPDLPRMNVQTLFDMASLTKVIGTTTSIMWLVDKGLIDVNDPVAKYIPAFNTTSKNAVTIRNLLTHTAGLYEWYPLFYISSKRKDTYNVIDTIPLKYPVGMQRRYSDLGFMLLGEIIEKVSGLSLDAFEKKNIFNPLGMTHTTYNPLQHGSTGNIAATSLGNPYETRMLYDSSLGFTIKGIDPGSWSGWRKYVVKGEVNDGNAWYASEGISGHAGLFSTVDDIQKLVNMLVNKGKLNGKQFISASVIDSFFVPDRFHNGLGWMMDSSNSFMHEGPAGTFGHTGFTGTSIAVVPQYHLSVILLINRQNMGLQKTGTYYNPNPLRRAVFDAVMNWYKGKDE